MRILLVSQSFWPNVGGAETMMRRLAAEWARQGHDVCVLATDLKAEPNSRGPEWDARRLDGFDLVRLHYLPVRWIGTLDFCRKVRKWLLRNRDRFDVAYVSMLKHAAFAALAAESAGGVPVVLRAEGAGETGDVAWQRNALLGGRIARRCRTAKAVVAPSRLVHRELLDAGYADARVILLENAVPVPAHDWSEERRRARRRELRLPDAPLTVFAGRLHRGKRLDTLLRSVSALRARGVAVVCVVVGEGPERVRLEDESNRLDISDRVVFVGRTDDVSPYLEASDIFILPSEHEGLSVALLEALVTGIPCTASDIDANRGLLAAEDLPLFPVGDETALATAIERLLARRDDGAYRNRLREAAAARFNLTALAQRHLRLFERVAASG